jgi:PAS domain S-box-containing protein
MLANAYWALCKYMMAIAPSADTAQIWNKALFLWPFIVSIALHFTLVFTQNSILKRKSAYILIYLPALVFSLLALTTDLISVTPTLQTWGYAVSYPTYSLAAVLHIIWSAAASLATLLLYAQYYFRINDKTKKQQTKFVTLSFAIPIIVTIITDSMFRDVGIAFPGLGNIAVSLTALVVAYSIVKHELFGLNIEVAAENVLSTMPDAVILVNLGGTIVKINKALEELTGQTEENIVGKTIKEIIDTAKVQTRGEETPQIMATLRKQKELKNYEIKFRTKNGEKKCVSLSCSLVSNNQGQEVGIAFVLHDVTEEKKMSKKLLDSQRLASIGELAGIIGHDLRNPLTGIRGAAYYLKTKHAPIMDDKDAAMFETIDKSIEYSNKIVSDLIDYSSDIKIDLENTTPNKLLQTALTHMPPPPNIQVINQTEEENLQFKGDIPKISRSFINLMKNAYDAMPNGGTLTIKTKKTSKNIVFIFKDTGEGMTPETLSKIWSPLFTTKAKGMGFGLAICKRTVEAHEGKIAAESEQKKGTTITVELPLDLESSFKP